MESKAEDVKMVEQFLTQYSVLKREIGRVIIGQDEVVESVLMAIFGRGHCLLVGVPGLAKTLLVHTISEVLGMSFNRIQFTPDLMPSDITGSEILDEHRQFRFIKGPIFAHVILADEINRTPPKTQSALLEAMQERNVTAAGKTYKLPDPFFVLATQNPIEQEGTYPLPEAQLDRFMFNIKVDYPSFDEEVKIVKSTTGFSKSSVDSAMNEEEVLKYQELVTKLPVADNVMDYAVKLAVMTRPGHASAPDFISDYLSWGAGPRASQYLIVGAKCHALLNGKLSPDIEDVQAVAPSVLRHRIVRNYKAEAEGLTEDKIIDKLL